MNARTWGARNLLGVALASVVVACASPTATPSSATASPATSPAPAAVATPGATVGATPSPELFSSEILGNWIRTQSCRQSLAAFRSAGFEDQLVNWVIPNWVAEGAAAPPGRECRNARLPEEHSHFFTPDGQFGSLDTEGSQVDFGDFEVVDADTLSFPSHAAEFGYDRDILVTFEVDGSTATFSPELPAVCTDACRQAYGWALSAFFAGSPWQRADAP